MRPFYFDTEFSLYRIDITQDNIGADVEVETLVGNYKGKYDLTSGGYNINGVQLSSNISAVIYANSIPDIEAGYIIYLTAGIRYRIESVDKSTLRGRLAHIEIFLVQENG